MSCNIVYSLRFLACASQEGSIGKRTGDSRFVPMAAPRKPVPLASDGPVVLPPLLSTGGPIIYRVKLTDEQIEEMLAAGSSGVSLEVLNQRNGSLRVGEQQHDVCFRPLEKSSIEPEFCLTRRGNCLRSVSTIAGEVDVKRKMTKGVSSITKQRTIEAAKASKDRAIEMINAGDEPRPRLVSAGRKRLSDKRPKTAAAQAVKRPRTSDGRISMNGPSAAGLVRRIPASVASKSPSPHVSPPVASSQQSTALQSRRISALGSNGTLQHAGLPPRGTPSPSSGLPSHNPLRSSANPSPAASRVASPAQLSSATSSPGTDINVSKAELRKHVIHLLALQDMSIDELRKRLGAGLGDYDHVRSAVKAVALSTMGSKFKLRPESWGEVTAEYLNYSAPERDFVRRELSRHKAVGNGGSGSGSGGSDGSGGSHATQGSAVSPSTGPSSSGVNSSRYRSQASEIRQAVTSSGGPSYSLPQSSPRRHVSASNNDELDRFVDEVNLQPRQIDERRRITSDDEEAACRTEFKTLWPRYCALHAALDDMKVSMARLLSQRTHAAKPTDLQSLDNETGSYLMSIRERWDRYSTALSHVHALIECQKRMIAEWCSRQ